MKKRQISIRHVTRRAALPVLVLALVSDRDGEREEVNDEEDACSNGEAAKSVSGWRPEFRVVIGI